MINGPGRWVPSLFQILFSCTMTHIVTVSLCQVRPQGGAEDPGRQAEGDGGQVGDALHPAPGGEHVSEYCRWSRVTADTCHGYCWHVRGGAGDSDPVLTLSACRRWWRRGASWRRRRTTAGSGRRSKYTSWLMRETRSSQSCLIVAHCHCLHGPICPKNLPIHGAEVYKISPKNICCYCKPFSSHGTKPY